MENTISDITDFFYFFFILALFTVTLKLGWTLHLIETPTITYFGRCAFFWVLNYSFSIFYIDSTDVTSIEFKPEILRQVVF